MVWCANSTYFSRAIRICLGWNEVADRTARVAVSRSLKSISRHSRNRRLRIEKQQSIALELDFEAGMNSENRI